MEFRQVISHFILNPVSENISCTSSTHKDHGISMKYLNIEIDF